MQWLNTPCKLRSILTYPTTMTTSVIFFMHTCLLSMFEVNARLHKISNHCHHNHFTALFPGPPGTAGAGRELLDFMVQGEINRGRHTGQPAGHHSIQTNQCPPPPSPHSFTGRMPFLRPNQQCQSTEGNQRIRIRENTLEFSSTVLTAPSPYA